MSAVIKETNLDEIIEEDLVERIDSDNVDIDLNQLASNDREAFMEKEELAADEKDQEKDTKTKRRRSLFRKSKKDKKSKSLDESSKITAVESVRIEQEHDGEKHGKSVAEKRSLFKRKSTKSRDLVEEDASTQTGNDANVEIAQEAFVEENAQDNVPKVRKRSFAKRLSKLKKSTKWTNTTSENNETAADKDEEKEENTIKTQSPEKEEQSPCVAFECNDMILSESETSPRHDTSLENNVSQETDSTQDSDEQNSAETFIIKEGVEEEAIDEGITDKTTPSPVHFNQAMMQSSQNPFLETYDSEFTNVTAIPDESSEVSRNTVTMENVTREGCVDKQDMEDIPLQSDESQIENSGKSESSVPLVEDKKQPSKPDKLDYVLVGRPTDKSTDESFFLAKKAVKAYKNAHLSKQYCHACCSVM